MRVGLLRDLSWVLFVIFFMISVVLLTQHNQLAKASASKYHVGTRARKMCYGIFRHRRPSIFTKIIKRQEPATILYEDSRVIAFLGLHKVTPIQFLVVPKKQLETLEEAQVCDEGLLGHMLRVASRVARRQGIRRGYRLVINNGPNALQVVRHIHLHVFGGRRMTWPPGV